MKQATYRLVCHDRSGPFDEVHFEGTRKEARERAREVAAEKNCGIEIRFVRYVPQPNAS